MRLRSMPCGACGACGTACLHKDSEKIVNQKKTLKNLIDGSLDVIEQTYSIKHNENKRVPCLAVKQS